MSNLVFAFPNFADAGYYEPVLSGGSWEEDLPLANLQDPVLSLAARSADDANASTRINADLLVPRDVRLVSLHAYNFGRAAQVRCRASGKIAWSGVRLAASAAGAATSLSVERPAGSAMIRPGDSFTLTGATK